MTQSLQKKKICYCLAAVIIVLFQGFRWRTGTDWEPYYNTFIYALTKNYYDLEPGFYVLNKVVRFFSSEYTVFLVLNSLLNLYLIKKFAENFGLFNSVAVLLYFFATTMFPIRMTTATCVFLCSYKYIENRNFYKYLFVLLIATSIHASVIVALPFYFIVNREYSGKSLALIYVISCVLGFATSFLFEGFLNLFSLDLFVQSDFASTKINAYMDENQESVRSLFSIILSLANGLVFISLFSYIRNNFFSDSRSFSVLFYLYVFGLSLNRIVVNTIPYMARLSALFTAGFVLMLLLGIRSAKAKYRPLLIVALCIYLFLIFLRPLQGEYNDLYLPYYSIFSDSQRFSVY